jgi:two-component system, cell cycle response regulator DivK
VTSRILVADDDLDNRTIAKEALEMAGFAVLQAVNGLEAVEAFRVEKPDLILMDLSMPKLDGWEATRRIRAMPEGGLLPILAFTAHALRGDDLKAKAAGCDDYIAKPCAPRDVIEKVKEWLKKKPVVREDGR